MIGYQPIRVTEKRNISPAWVGLRERLQEVKFKLGLDRWELIVGGKKKALGSGHTMREGMEFCKNRRGSGNRVIPDGWSLKCGRDSAGALRPQANRTLGKGSMCPPCSLVGGSLPIQIPIFKGEDCLKSSSNHEPTLRTRLLRMCRCVPLLPRVVNSHGSMVEQQIFSCSGIGEL